MQSEPNPQTKSFWHGIAYISATVAGLAILVAGFFYFRPVAPEIDGGENAPRSQFSTWSKPDVVIVFSGQMHGFIQACGCSDPQLGGLARRFNFIESLKAKGWPVVALDVGEIPQAQGPQQMLKYQTAVKALKAMGYFAIGLGKTELNMPLTDALAHTSLNDPFPTPISSNIDQMKKGQINETLGAREFKVIDTVSPRLGIVSIVDSGIQAQVAQGAGVKFPVAPVQALAAALKETRANRADVNILLYQGTEQEAGNLLTNFNKFRATDKTVPVVPIVLCLSNESEPPGRARSIAGAQVMTVGHKGRYVGVIGLFRQGPNFQLKYELVSMGPEWETKPGAKNPVADLMQEYAKSVRDQNFISKFPRSQHPLQVQVAALGLQSNYVGSEICANCHQHAYDVWMDEKHERYKGKDADRKHSMAFTNLVNKAKHPNLRQFDGECVVCHTVGFSIVGGYEAKGNSAKLNKKLEQVGCESCHGPASAHVNQPQNAQLYPLINPLSSRRIPPANAVDPKLKANFLAKQQQNLNDFCQKCHDAENDVHWGETPFPQHWEKVQHMTPPSSQAPRAGLTPPPPVIEKTPVPVGIRIDTDIKPGEEKK